MKANATGSKATTTKVRSTKKIAVPVIPVVIAKPGRRGRAKVDVPLPIVPPAPVEPVGTSKQARLISLLNAAPGATLEQMMLLTGWQAHTVRGTISGVLRKRLGLNVVCDAADAADARRYRIVAAVGA
ncbi:MAG TPA: DUF3489 domain-containing protein [Burkholderiaceae bacterium]|nr:DUF3489 domain-containing protein [Burkholderiaceae bacterium]